ncbi:MAG: hypothetical protein M1547_13620 [Gammaproteobacteria bacterium]|nr:hypothetical protein [Gammaproteobacteria bacterium]
MKTLKRLRMLYSKSGAEDGPSPDLRSWTAQSNKREADFEEETERNYDTDLHEHDVPGRTLDGLRKRIPGIHEDFPPDGYGIDPNDQDDLP